MVSIVIPAFNEALTIGPLVRSVIGHASVTEVIVVDDGSTDATAVEAEEAGARIVVMDRNSGKAAAMERGVGQAREDIILFIDADLSGFTHEKLDSIIIPVQEGRYDMYMAILSRRTFWLNRMLHIFPILTGTRAVRRSLWDSVPSLYKKGFQIEIALNYFSRRSARGAGFRILSGITHRIKEKKHGLMQGIRYRLIMIAHLISISVQLYVIRSLKDMMTDWNASLVSFFTPEQG